jgi:hypothetical protein|tara:strand:- start:14807 stop:15586 length:780 start_codon:yes stop_codon:yes gene_type:complete
MTDNKEENDKKEVTKKTSTDVAISSAFEEDAGGGLENMTADDFTIPRLKILQALSPEVNKRDGKYLDGAAAGDITNTVTKELYTEDSVCTVIPVAYKRMYLEWQPRESGGGLVNQHTDASILAETKKDANYADVLPNGNYIQTSATHYCLVVGAGDSFQQVMIPMAGTQLKKSRTWNSVMSSIKTKSSKGNVFTPPSYSQKYKLSTVQESNDRGNWFGWNIELIGALTETEMHLYESAKYFANTVTADAPATASEDVPF